MTRTLKNLRLEIDTDPRSAKGPPFVQILVNETPLPIHHLEGSTNADDHYVGEFFLAAVTKTLHLQNQSPRTWLLRRLCITADEPEWGPQSFAVDNLLLLPNSAQDLLAYLPKSHEV